MQWIPTSPGAIIILLKRLALLYVFYADDSDESEMDIKGAGILSRIILLRHHR
jgi:hypothetical protein